MTTREILSAIIVIGAVASTALFIPVTASTQEWKEATIMSKKKSRAFPDETRITFRLPMNIPLGAWYTCEFYNTQSQVIASAHHVLRERVPTTGIKVSEPDEISFALCTNR